MRFQIDYSADHTWQCDDHFGASLCSLDDLFSQSDYLLVCCNSQTRFNAFFVRQDHDAEFADVPNDLEALFL